MREESAPLQSSEGIEGFKNTIFSASVLLAPLFLDCDNALAQGGSVRRPSRAWPTLSPKLLNFLFETCLVVQSLCGKSDLAFEGLDRHQLGEWVHIVNVLP
jgi:hypothetical protein